MQTGTYMPFHCYIRMIRYTCSHQHPLCTFSFNLVMVNIIKNSQMIWKSKIWMHAHFKFIHTLPLPPTMVGDCSGGCWCLVASMVGGSSGCPKSAVVGSVGWQWWVLVAAVVVGCDNRCRHRVLLLGKLKRMWQFSHWGTPSRNLSCLMFYVLYI